MHRLVLSIALSLSLPACGDDGSAPSEPATTAATEGTGVASQGTHATDTGSTAAASDDGGAGSLLTTGADSTSTTGEGELGSCDECEAGEVCVRFSSCAGDACTSEMECLPDPGAAVVNCATAGDVLCGAFGPGFECYDEATGPYCCTGDAGGCANAG